MSTQTDTSLVPKQVQVAKDLLDLLTGAMYINPFCAIREYIQNAVDAIEDAVAKGLYQSTDEGRIDLKISPGERKIVIRDNGEGCANRDFPAVLTAFGGSDKRGRERRGFRGIGRLAGLAYCRTLVFRSKSVEDADVLEMVWDCVRLKQLLYSDEKNYSLNQVVRSVVSVNRKKADGFPEHFFEVELQGVIRCANDELLDSHCVSTYLSQVAPVPFSPEFALGSEISAFLNERLGKMSFNIFVDASETPLVKPYRDSFSARPGVRSFFSCVEFLELPGIRQEVDAVGWLAHHEYLGAIGREQVMGGLRLRVGNIQIGSSEVLSSVFPQPRFNEWSCGEIHILNDKVRPNGRRDDLEFSAHVSNLYDKLRPIGQNIARKCRKSSNTRSVLSRFYRECTDSECLMDLLAEGYFGYSQKGKYFSYLEKQENQLSEIVAQLSEQLADGSSLSKRLGNWRRKRSNSFRKMSKSSSDAMLPKSKASTYRRVFETIYDGLRDKREAASLIRQVAKMARE